MIDMQEVLTGTDIEMTLANEFGETHYCGNPDTLRPTNKHYTLIFKTDGQYKNTNPFTMVLLHSGSLIHEVVQIKPTFMGESKTVELLYS